MTDKIILFKTLDQNCDFMAGKVNREESDSETLVLSNVICIDFYEDSTVLYPYGNGFVDFDSESLFAKHVLCSVMRPSKTFLAEYLEKAVEISKDLKAIKDQAESDELVSKNKSEKTPSNIAAFRPKK